MINNNELKQMNKPSAESPEPGHTPDTKERNADAAIKGQPASLEFRTEYYGSFISVSSVTDRRTYDAAKLAERTISIVYTRLIELSLFVYFVPPIVNESLRDSSIGGPLKRDVSLLVNVTNGHYDYESKRHEVNEIYKTFLSMSWMMNDIPRGQFPSELKEVMAHVQIWLERDELISISEAATILFGEITEANTMKVKEIIERGELQQYTDSRVVNLEDKTRVSRREVESLK